MIHEGETELLPPEDLTPHPKNARRGDIESIAASIRANGWYGRVMGQRSTGYILVGNHRVAAARRAGLDTIPVEWIDVDDELALRILLADNRSSDLAGYELRYIYFLDPSARQHLTVPEIPYDEIPDDVRMYRGERASEAGFLPSQGTAEVQRLPRRSKPPRDDRGHKGSQS